MKGNSLDNINYVNTLDLATGDSFGSLETTNIGSQSKVRA